MHRVTNALIRYAPPEIEFVPYASAESADLQILQYWTSDLVSWIKSPRYALIYHCTNQTFPDSPIVGAPKEFIDRAVFVASWQPLPDGTKYYPMPLGADPELWFPLGNTQPIYTCMTTGYVAESECIQEVYNATRAVGGEMVHVGGDCIRGKGLVRYENVSDTVMRHLYNQSMYVSALRRGEGFEIGAVEALMSASFARPVIFDRPDQQVWLGKFCITIHEDTPENVEAQLRDIFSVAPKPVTPEERAEVVSALSWEPIVKGFWKALLDRM
jgi:hypothetical protein